VTNHSRVALEERGKHGAILVGGAATTSARDEPSNFSSCPPPPPKASWRPSTVLIPAVEERIELDGREPIAQVGEHLESELLELAGG
jgi:hypothetical protein